MQINDLMIQNAVFNQNLVKNTSLKNNFEMILNNKSEKNDDKTIEISNKNQNKIQKEQTLKALKEQTDAFESILLKMVLDISIKQNNTLFPESAGSKIYADMYNDTMAKSLSGGFGFSDLLYDYLKEQI